MAFLERKMGEGWHQTMDSSEQQERLKIDWHGHLKFGLGSARGKFERTGNRRERVMQINLHYCQAATFDQKKDNA